MVEIREGEGLTEGDISVTLLADIEQIGITETRSRPYCDDPWPPLHVHAQHAEVRFVLEGELTLRLEDGEHRVGPDTWIFIPPGVVHTFGVTGDQPAGSLQIHTPNCGFADAIRGVHTATTEEELRNVRATFDLAPAPESGGADPGLVVVTRAGGAEGETIGGRRPDRRATLLVDTDELTVTEFAYGPNLRGADLHVHHTHADAFFVLEGELAIRYRDGVLEAPAGTLVVFPPDVVHGFDNGPTSSRFFNLHMPASGFADYLRGRNPDFDQHDPPADGGVDPSAIVAVRLSQ